MEAATLQRIIDDARGIAAPERAQKIIDHPAMNWSAITDSDLEQLLGLFTGMRRTTANTRFQKWRKGLTPQNVSSVATQELGGSGGDHGKRFWFLYYWNECSICRGKTPADLEKMAEAFNAFFKPEKKDGKYEPRAPEAQWDDATLLTHLENLLAVGFVKFPGNTTKYEERDESDTLVADVLRNREDAMQVGWGWRADGRTYDDIVSAEGFKSKADSDGWARSHGMRSPWHPYGKPENRKWLWFRKGQVDNCLYTIISIGEEGDWKGYLPFPERNLETDKAKVLKVEAVCEVDGGARQVMELKATTSWLYLFLVSGIVLDTGLAQEKLGGTRFPEKGMKGIPVNNIFGAIQFVRFHHGVDKAAGFTALPANIFEAVRYRQGILTRYGADLYKKLKSVFDQPVKAGPTSVRWTPDGFTDIAETFQFGGQGPSIKVLSLTPKGKAAVEGK